MTTDELTYRAKERLSGTSNPSLPPEETLAAIIELGEERDSAREQQRSLEAEIGVLKGKLGMAEERLEESKFQQRRAEDDARNQGWLAQELGNFVRDVANRIYEGAEAAAAQRVYDLNASSIRKKRLNAYNYDSLDEAKQAYIATIKDMPFDNDGFNNWLFKFAQRP